MQRINQIWITTTLKESLISIQVAASAHHCLCTISCNNTSKVWIRKWILSPSLRKLQESMSPLAVQYNDDVAPPTLFLTD